MASASQREPDPSEEAAEALAAAELPGSHFEIYRLAVEMADRVCARRGIANSFFLREHGRRCAPVMVSDAARWTLAVAGILVSVLWWALLKSYRDLNSAKFDIILAMEERLPVRVYGDEWKRLRREPVTLRSSLRRRELRSWVAQYRELGRVERVVPWIFALIYLAEIVRDVNA
ncbi:MAG: hypothetical protein M3419_02915 [Actinomycetota bacterium]|nr:hypothetical protein [Actinomycetota bacterium]